MNRAIQGVVNQSTNQMLVRIRQSEVYYYTILIGTMGTQVTLIGGFTYGYFLSDLLTDDSTEEQIAIQYIYWIVGAIVMVFVLHIWLTTQFVTVYGTGLALNGPAGSMVRAAEGMRDERSPLLIAYIILLIFFTIGVLLLCFFFFEFWSAVAVSIIFLFAAYKYYCYCQRIYLRFYWDPNTVSQEETLADLEAFPYVQTKSVSISKDEEKDDKVHSSPQLYHLTSSSIGDFFFPHRFSVNESHGKPQQDEVYNPMGSVPNLRVTSQNNNSIQHHPHDVVMEGYLLKKGSYGKMDFTKEPWERRYFVLFYNGELFMYKTRQDFRSNPTHPIYHRPLYLKDFLISFSDGDNPTAFHHSHHLPEISGKALNETLLSPTHLFEIILKPIENLGYNQKYLVKNWILRCDTEEELINWSSVIHGLLPIENLEA
jgi:hypothetical protein